MRRRLECANFDAKLASSGQGRDHLSTRRSAELVSFVALVALTACDRNKSSDTAPEGGPSPTSSAADSPAPPPSPQEIASLARWVERGQGDACGDEIVLNYIMSEAVRSNRFPETSGWTVASREAFYDTYTSDVRTIVLNAHDPVAKSVSCAAKYFEEAASGYFSTDVFYDVQVTVDGGVVATIRNLGQLQQTAGNAVAYYQRMELQPSIDAQRRTDEAAQRVVQQAESRAAMLERANRRCRAASGDQRSHLAEVEMQLYLENLSEPQNDQERATRACLERALNPPPPPPPNRVTYTGPPVILPGPPPPPPRPAVPDDRPTVIANPRWQRPPRPRFPGMARLRRVTTGSAEVSCRVRPDGSLTSCRVVSETPVGFGFGEQAERAGAEARVTSQTFERLAPGGSVTFTIRFEDDQPRGD